MKKTYKFLVVPAEEIIRFDKARNRVDIRITSVSVVESTSPEFPRSTKLSGSDLVDVIEGMKEDLKK